MMRIIGSLGMTYMAGQVCGLEAQRWMLFGDLGRDVASRRMAMAAVVGNTDAAETLDALEATYPELLRQLIPARATP